MALQIGSPPKRFQSTWDTTQAGSSNNQVVLPLVSNGDYDFRIDWGDGTSNRDTITAYNQAEVTHTYDSTGVYEIRVIGGITGWQFNGGDDDKITSITQWGPLTLKNGFRAFYQCSNLNIETTDTLDLGTTNNMREMFRNSLFSTQANFGSWDVSNITNLQTTFWNCESFDEDLSNWDISNVTTLRPFKECDAFNNGGSTGINNWDTSKTTNMIGAFEACLVFNQPIGNWDVSGVTNMSYMLRSCRQFDQDLSNWDTSSVTSMIYLFDNATGFNNAGETGIYDWDVSSCTNFSQIFTNADSFNQNIGGWTFATGLDKSISAFRFFQQANIFNNGGSPAISGWNTSRFTIMGSMFNGAKLFNQPIGTWDTSSVTNIGLMLGDADAFDQDLSNWIVTGVTHATNFMSNANGLSTTNYDRTLSGWSSQAVQNGVNIHFGGSQYSTATGAAYRATLVSKGWTITDGGAV